MSQPGTVIAGRYRLDSRVGTGGMGSVWEAWDELLHRRVALKELHPQPGLSPEDARLAADRAMREARITARLHHPHAVPIYDVVDHAGSPCLVMPYLDAQSLQALIAEHGALDVADVAGIGSQIAAALDAAHEAGIVHRDVKPGNVLIEPDGTAKITDFGIAHALGDATLTSAGMVTGTPAYLAPEVARGGRSTSASDVFSLGATLYTALEGTSPVGSGENPMATLHQVASGQLRPPRRSGPLTPVLERMLAYDPAARPSMAQVHRMLDDARAAAVDPAAAATTRRLAPAPAGPPSSATVALPPSGGPPPAERRRGRGPLIAALVAAALILAGIGALLATQLGGGSGSPQAGGHTTASPRHTSAARTPSTSASSRTTTSRPPSTPPPSTPPPSTPPPSTAGHAAAGQPAAAVTDYYALLPGNTDAAWNRLTSRYQNQHANGRDSYDEFWDSIQRVTVGDARNTGPDAAEATITYVYEDGRTVVEDTAFTLKREEGILKIDDTQVLSSHTE